MWVTSVRQTNIEAVMSVRQTIEAKYKHTHGVQACKPTKVRHCYAPVEYNNAAMSYKMQSMLHLGALYIRTYIPFFAEMSMLA